MTEFTPDRLAELKAVAEAATPGPWQWMDGGVFHSTSFGWQPVTLPGESAQYIATFDPPTTLSLVSALDAKTYEAERLGLMCLGLIKQRDEARAEVERVREAATEATNQENNNGRTHYGNCWKHHLHCLAAKILYETERQG